MEYHTGVRLRIILKPCCGRYVFKERIAPDVRLLANSEGCHRLVRYKDGRPISGIEVAGDGVNVIYTRPKYRRQGHATYLFDLAKTLFKQLEVGDVLTYDGTRWKQSLSNRKNIMNVKIELRETSQPILHNADNTYQKGDFFCVKVGSQVYKYPFSNIWRVTEEYAKGK